MHSLEHILIATDFGSSSVRAVHFGAELARRLGAHITVLHVVHEPVVYPVEAPFMLSLPKPDDPEHESRRELDAFLATLGARAPEYSGVVVFGEPWHAIVTYAEESECDLVVIGTHGRAGLSRWLLGSVAEKVVRTSHVPVLTVRADDAREHALAGQ